jgi:hypothetical protein
MGLTYKNLDEKTRRLMLLEIERDISAGTLYVSDNLNPHGQLVYPELIKAAARNGSDLTLAMAIHGWLNAYEKPRKLKSGGFSKPPVMRVNAHEMLAEGEFNRFYIRGVCLRAIEEGAFEVIVYRAKMAEHARAESEQKIGQRIAAEALLRDLRAHPGLDTALGLPPGPNSPSICRRELASLRVYGAGLDCLNISSLM